MTTNFAVVKRTVMLTILFSSVVLPSRGANSVTGIILDGNSAKDLEEFLLCQASQNELQRLCFTGTESCSSRCGEFMSDKSAKEHAIATCSCDSLCTTYQDCCWDFRNACPLAFEKSRTAYKSLRGAISGCQGGLAFIAGRQNNEENSSISDARLPVVTYRDNLDLHFKERFVFQQFFKDEDTSPENVLSWNKEIREKDTMLSSKDVKRFFTHGEASNRLKESLFNIPPSNVTPRLCPPPISQLQCPRSDNEVCPYSKNIILDIKSTPDFCRSVLDVSAVFGHTTLGFPSSTSQPPTPSGLTTQSTHGYFHFTRLYSQCEWYVRPYMDVRGSSIFSLLMSFSPDHGVQIENATFVKNSRWHPVVENLSNMLQGTKELSGSSSSPFFLSTIAGFDFVGGKESGLKIPRPLLIYICIFGVLV